ncbi:MAG: hypothetical protein HC846_08675 [Blastocatellia bacterium]|nr:hypothetical protein [Blastocatellia bacterium]
MAYVCLGVTPFPLDKAIWKKEEVFDILEFLFDHISKPNSWTEMVTDTGFAYYDYDSYDQAIGQREFAQLANIFLRDYEEGYEINSSGMILAIGKEGLESILNSEIIEYDEINVDSRVRDAT